MRLRYNKTVLFTIVILNQLSCVALAVESKPSEAQFVLQKFGITIGLVFLCIGIIFFGLKLYQKYIQNIGFKKTEQTQLKDSTLKSSTNLEEAISGFLERTKPNQ